MPTQSLSAERVSVFQVLRSGFERLARLSQRHVWRRRPRRLRLCETLSLGNRNYLAVVRYRQQQFLLGGSGSSIVLLTELSAPARTAAGVAEEQDSGR